MVAHIDQADQSDQERYDEAYEQLQRIADYLCPNLAKRQRDHTINLFLSKLIRMEAGAVQ